MSSPSDDGGTFDPTFVPAGPTRRPDSDRAGPHLLFGVIALQNNFITREQLVAAFDVWVQNKSRNLGQILVDAGAITSDLHDVLSRLVAKFLEKHDGDLERSLGSLSSIPLVRRELERLADEDLSVSLGFVGIPDSGDGAGLQTTPYRSREMAGRFRILRPHAKGGLGQVSVALDQELNREVALKEILDHHSGNATARERFVLEAEITGGLEHPGIVPVYALGRSADGRPFYAMRFVKGDSLKQAIEEFHKADAPDRGDLGARQLALRQLLGRFLDVCYAIEYAHCRGVLHRDLKPGNIMVGKFGETLVVDWGLAKLSGRTEVASDDLALRPSSALSSSVQTQPGSAIGTPAYMSPEQAAGKLDDLGAATDVYSLGATLYHLLCGRPPFGKENVGEILQKVQQGKFAWPRTIEPETPRGLEAICLKAMALTPVDRYPTARSLANDIEHWLADEPIIALRETAVAATARWFRKHRAWAMSAAGALTIVAIVSSFAAISINSARVRAQTNFRIARAAVNDLLTEFAQEKLADEPGMTDVRRDLLEKARSYNQAFLEQQEQDPELRLQTARAHQLVADIQRILSNYAEAENGYKSSIAMLQPLTNEQAENHTALQYLAECHTQLGEVYRLSSRVDEADRFYDRSQKLTEDLIGRFNRPEFRKELAQIHDNRGILFRDSNRPQDALSEFQHAIGLLKTLMDEFPQEAVYPQRVARGYLNSGPAMLKIGKQKEAQENYETAVELQKQLIERFPRTPDYQSDLAATYNNLGRLRNFAKQSNLAILSFSEAVNLLERLADRFPGVRQFRRELARVKNNLAGSLANSGKLNDAEKQLMDARDLCRNLIGEDPEAPDFQYGLAETFDNLAWLELTKKPQPDFVLAERYAESGMREIRRPFELNPENLNYKGVRNDLHKYLAFSDLGQKRHANAAVIAQSLSRFANDDENPHYLAAIILARCVALVQEDQELSDTERKSTARGYSDRAVEQLRQAAQQSRPFVRDDMRAKEFDCLRDREDFKAIESVIPAP